MPSPMTKMPIVPAADPGVWPARRSGIIDWLMTETQGEA